MNAAMEGVQVRVKCPKCKKLGRYPFGFGSIEDIQRNIISDNLIECSECGELIKVGNENISARTQDGRAGFQGHEF